MTIKQVSCSVCGAPKMKESLTAYIYCDFCGQYIDLDFRKAITTKGSKMPGPEYQQLCLAVAADVDAALKKRETRHGLRSCNMRYGLLTLIVVRLCFRRASKTLSIGKE